MLYQSITSITLEICLTLLGILFTLNIDIGYEILWVLVPLLWTKFLSMKLPVALQSRSVLLEWTLLVSVVQSSTVRIREALCASSALTENCFGSLFSHFGLQVAGVVAGEKGEEEGEEYDYRFTCTCIGFFYVKYTEPIY